MAASRLFNELRIILTGEVNVILSSLLFAVFIVKHCKCQAMVHDTDLTLPRFMPVIKTHDPKYINVFRGEKVVP